MKGVRKALYDERLEINRKIEEIKVKMNGIWRKKMSNEDLKSMIMMTNLQLAKMQYRIDRSKIILKEGDN